MGDKKSFEVFFLKKTPYVSNILLILCVIMVIIVLVLKFYVYIDPAYIKHMYIFIATIPILLIVYIKSNQKHKGGFVFNDNSFTVLLSDDNLEIPFSSIRTIKCYDLNWRGRPSKQFSIKIYMSNEETISLRLKKNSDIEQFGEKLWSYKDLKVEYDSTAKLTG